ncbi:MAG: InlB B-repeat-containing protein [Oscillospiraceae bacterium]|nr:InlB B-repeat-containing protein [Oscillospiraceae bacterium]
MKKNLTINRIIALTMVFIFTFGMGAGVVGAYENECQYEHNGLYGYIESSPCVHSHNDDCGYSEGTPEVPCNCDIEDDNDFECTYIPAVESTLCSHSHDYDCGYADAVSCDHTHNDDCDSIDAVSCMYVCINDCFVNVLAPAMGMNVGVTNNNTVTVNDGTTTTNHADLVAAFTFIGTTAGTFTITLYADQELVRHQISAPVQHIRLISNDTTSSGERQIRLSENSRLFVVGASSDPGAFNRPSLTLDKNITLVGRTQGINGATEHNTNSLIHVQNAGFIMLDGSKIIGNTTIGGGEGTSVNTIQLSNNSTFIMEGGEITDNATTVQTALATGGLNIWAPGSSASIRGGRIIGNAGLNTDILIQAGRALTLSGDAEIGGITIGAVSTASRGNFTVEDSFGGSIDSINLRGTDANMETVIGYWNNQQVIQGDGVTPDLINSITLGYFVSSTLDAAQPIALTHFINADGVLRAFTYTITYNLDGGTQQDGIWGGYSDGMERTLPTAPTKTGYTFGGWFDNVGLTGSAVTSISATDTGNKEFWAKWTVNTYTITYNLDGGTQQAGTWGSYTFGTALALPTSPTKTGYTFGGWFDNAGLTGSAVTTISATDTGNKEFWAKWTPNTYTIAYNLDGGTQQAGTWSLYTFGTAFALPTAPTKDGFVFDGWYDNVGLTGSAVTTISATDTGNKEFWVKWRALSSAADITAIAGQTISTWGGGDGLTAATQKTASINVVNNVTAITSANVTVSQYATVVVTDGTLSVGENTVKIEVTAENGAKLFYEVTITREEPPTPPSMQLPIIEQTDTWTGSGNAFARIDATPNDFIRLTHNNVVVDPSNYTVTAGSTIITKHEGFLKTLPVGTHLFRAEFTTGFAEYTLVINATNENNTPGNNNINQSGLPKTGIDSNIMLLISLMMLSAMGALISFVMIKYIKRQKTR